MNTEQQSELKVFPREHPGEKNGREKSPGSEFKSSRNSNSVTNKHHQQCRLTQIKICLKKLCRNRNLSIKALCLQLISFIDRHVDH